MGISVIENFFKETITRSVSLTGATSIYLSALPTPSEGYVVISPSSSTLREIVYYTAKGTDGNGSYITVTLANRGLGGTTAQTHVIGEPVRMNVTAEHIKEISDAIDQIVAAGAQDASTITKGIAKLSVAPASATEPIAVGDNDPRLLGLIPGIVSSYAGLDTPAGWLVCDGSAVSRTTYADLFAIIGTRYGEGDGTTTFNLPLAPSFGSGSVTTEDLVSYWSFNQSSGDATDSISSNTLTNSNVTYEAGRVGNAAVFDSAESPSLSINDNASLSITGDISFACWVKLDSAPSNDAYFTIAGKRLGADQCSYNLTYKNVSETMRLEFFYSSSGSGSGSTTVNLATQTLTLGTWYHIAVTVDVSAKAMKFYVNGEEISSDQAVANATAIYNSTSPFVVGASDGANFFDGKIDELYLYSRVLTEAEVQGVYNSYFTSIIKT